MPPKQPTIVTREQIWKTLSKVNVNDNVEKIGQLTFLSWGFAHMTLMKWFPNSYYEILDDIVYPDGSMEVRVELTIERHPYFMWLPVMDYRHQAIQNPSSTDINKARMRCLTKAIAMAGCGFYIYCGHDLPISEEDDKKQAEKPLQAGVQSISQNASPSPTEPDLPSQLDVYRKVVPLGKMKGKTYGEVTSTPDQLTKSITYWEAHSVSHKEKEEALLHLGNLKELRDSQIVRGVAG
jgi:hypothetical protein